MIPTKPRRKPLVVSIAGSDPTGGAGIQADLRSFEASGVHGFTVLTALTSQTTENVLSWKAVDPKLVKEQLFSLLETYNVKYVKCGMLPTKEIVDIVIEAKKTFSINLVVDPLLESGSGSSLVESGMKEHLISNLFPVFDEEDVLTPNAQECKVFTGIDLKNVNDALAIGSAFAELGPKRLAITGGHVIESGAQVIDYLYYDGGLEIFTRERVKGGTSTHGTGCIFSSTLASQLAHTHHIFNAMTNTEDFMEKFFEHLLFLPMKKENGDKKSIQDSKEALSCVPILDLAADESERKVMEEVYDVYQFFRSKPHFAKMVPEVKTNISISLKGASNKDHVAAIEGRITVVNGIPTACGPIRFGVSNHTARLVLTAQEKDPEIRAVMNLKYKPEYVRALANEGFYLFEIDRSDDNSRKENNTMQWVINESFSVVKKIPDIIWDDGEKGKEPMLRVFAQSGKDMIDKLTGIHRAIVKLDKKS